MTSERFQITSFSSVTSVVIAENASLPPRVNTLTGLSIAINANSNWLGTIAFDNGVGIVDVTSFFTGAASVGGAATKLFYQKGVLPWRVWLNVTSCPGNVNVAAGIS